MGAMNTQAAIVALLADNPEQTLRVLAIDDERTFRRRARRLVGRDLWRGFARACAGIRFAPLDAKLRPFAHALADILLADLVRYPAGG